MLSLSEVPQQGPSRDEQYQPILLENVSNRNYHESGSAHVGQVPSTDQQHYPSHSLRRNDGNRDGKPSGLPGKGGHYPY